MVMEEKGVRHLAVENKMGKSLILWIFKTLVQFIDMVRWY